MLSLNFVAANNETISGNESVSVVNESLLESTAEDIQIDNELNGLEEGKVIEIRQDNYESYFDARTGKILKSAAISSGDTLKIGNISERAFVIDRQLTLMPITPNDQIKNGFIHLVKGSDGSTITNLTINNTKVTLKVGGVSVGELHGIWLSHSNNNLISYNTIRIANSGGVYAMPMGWSSNNRIIYNDMKTYISTNIIMGDSHYNLISHNSLEVLSYSDMSVTNLIYFNPFTHADYTGTPLCKGNIISYNYLKGFCTLPMSIILQFEYANHEGTVVANNTIIKGSIGINLNGDNVSVYGNTVTNSAVGISVSGSGFTVWNNTVSGTSQQTGIRSNCDANSKGIIYDNNVTFDDVSVGMSLTNNIEAYNNNINLKNYGIGISLSGENTTVHHNNIRNNHDAGVSILGSYNTVSKNIITTNNIGVTIPSSLNGKVRYYNNTITDNKITSESYGISIVGLVYNSVIKDNIIETNRSIGINIEITDKESNTQLDNIVNGVIFNASAIIINDDNFYQFFDEDGYLVYKFEEGKSKVIFLTFLSNKNLIFDDKITVISNKMDNLLFNVTVKFEGDAEGSIIRDFNFINYDKEAIVIDNVNDITVSKNNITDIFKKGSEYNSAILIQGVCNNEIITQNNIYINSKTDYVYAITAPAIESNGRMNRDFSNGFKVNDNTIIIISESMAEAIYTDAIAYSEFDNNKINIIAKGYAYGIALANLIGKLANNSITNNEIVIHSDEMAYLIELHMVENTTVANNTLYGQSSGVYGVGVYSSSNVTIENNTISAFGGDLKKIKSIEDVLGIGNAAISSIRFVDNITINNNLIITNITNPIAKINVTDEAIVNVSSNSYVVSNSNFNTYFRNNELIKGNIEENGKILLYNLTNGQTIRITSPVVISSYDNNIPTTVSLILNKASNVTIYNINFVNSTIELKDSSYNTIVNNSFNSTKSNILIINSGENNTFANNSVNVNSDRISGIQLTKTDSNNILNNEFNLKGNSVKAIIIDSSNDNVIEGNIFLSDANDIIFIESTKSINDNIINNTMKGNASSIYGYYASNSNYGHVAQNDIEIRGTSNVTDQSGLYFKGSSMRNEVVDNHIESFSANGDDYAVMIMANRNLFNSIVNNFLVSSNGAKRANEAVYSQYGTVKDNTPIDIYVSADGSDETGDGSIYNPYGSITKAIEKSLNHAIIYVGSGHYNETNININKNVTIRGNGENVIIDAQSSQLFNISKNGILSINGVIIQNAHNVEGGPAFINNGKLSIVNSSIHNSSSYYDNSNPIFDHDVVYDEDGEMKSGHTLNCSGTGNGGAILNNGELYINASVFYNNFGHTGGVIADYGKLNIESSIFHNNQAVHGGVIFTDSNNEITIKNSLFMNNSALTSLDYCTIRIGASTWSIVDGYTYTYSSLCENPTGEGGVIYSKNTSILMENSTFMENCAKIGGVISTPLDSLTSRSNNANVNLKIDNCEFINNRANDTRKSSGSVNLDNYRYYSGFNGGVIYGAYNELQARNSEFYYNQATNDGGVIYAKANDGKLLDSIFMLNTAGTSGGVLEISKNFIIERCVLSNNSARYGGAIEYNSYEYYGHVQDHINIYNSTISNNRALNGGGAFNIGYANITVRDTNIVDNVAPSGNTFHSRVIGGQQDIDMRYNYWGKKGPDDSVWNAMSRESFYPITREMINWKPQVVDDDKPTGPIEVNPDDDSKGHGGNGDNPIVNPNPGSTDSSTSTGRTIGGNGNNEGSGNTYGPGSGTGTGGSGSGTGTPGTPYNPGNPGNTNSYGHIPGNTYTGQKVTGNYNSTSNANSKVDGTSNSNSQSRVNSSNDDSSLSTVGMISNAAASSSSDGGGQGESSSSADSSDSGAQSVSKSYEITEKLDEIVDDDKSMLTFIALAIITLLLLIIGYKRKERENEE